MGHSSSPVFLSNKNGLSNRTKVSDQLVETIASLWLMEIPQSLQNKRYSDWERPLGDASNKGRTHMYIYIVYIYALYEYIYALWLLWPPHPPKIQHSSFIPTWLFANPCLSSKNNSINQQFHGVHSGTGLYLYNSVQTLRVKNGLFLVRLSFVTNHGKSRNPMEFVQSSKRNLHLMLLMEEKRPDRLYTLCTCTYHFESAGFQKHNPQWFGDRIAIISYVKSKNCQSFSTIP